MVELYNANPIPLYISKIEKEEIEKLEKENFVFHNYNKAIAQAILHEIPKVEVEELSFNELQKIPSQRGAKGFGSTDK